MWPFDIFKKRREREAQELKRLEEAARLENYLEQKRRAEREQARSRIVRADGITHFSARKAPPPPPPPPPARKMRDGVITNQAETDAWNQNRLYMQMMLDTPPACEIQPTRPWNDPDPEPARSSYCAPSPSYDSPSYDSPSSSCRSSSDSGSSSSDGGGCGGGGGD